MNWPVRVALLVIGILLMPGGPKLWAQEHGEVESWPWSGYWWPLCEGGLQGPLTKYDQLTGRQAARWEAKAHPAGPEAAAWHGYCHGWAAAAVMESEPRQPREASGVDARRLSLGIGDLKGLLTACHTEDVANIYGERFSDDDGQEVRQDLAPDLFWYLLRLYVRQQRVPLIVDLEAGPEVWNHPVCRYEVRYDPHQEGQGEAELILVLVDNNVPLDFQGVKRIRQRYRFQAEFRQGSVVLGTGRWVGLSEEDHPDFAWYPLIQRAENPEVNYALVQKLVGEPSGPSTATSADSPEPVATEQPSALPAEPALPDRVLLSAPELLALVAEQTSHFFLDVTLDRFDGAHYQVGETFSVRGVSGQAGYLYLLHIDAQGHLALIYPLAGQDNRVAAHQVFVIPGRKDRYAFRVLPPAGINRIKAVVTTRPLELSGLQPPAEREARQTFRWHPTQRRQIETLLIQYARHRKLPPETVADIKPYELLGPFAQDEVAFYVKP